MGDRSDGRYQDHPSAARLHQPEPFSQPGLHSRRLMSQEGPEAFLFDWQFVLEGKGKQLSSLREPSSVEMVSVIHQSASL